MHWYMVLLNSDIPDIQANGFFERLHGTFMSSGLNPLAGTYYHHILESGEHLYFFPPETAAFHMETLIAYKAKKLDSPPNTEGIKFVDLSKK